jgi:hypothetical protein
MRGGSLASSAVMKLVQNNCATSATEMHNNKVDFIYKDVVNNYGSIYRMTGGAAAEQPEQPAQVQQIQQVQQVEQPCEVQQLDDSMWSKITMANANRFLRKTLNNRILDIYLKYLGITLLTPATLVPIALFMGQRTFNKVMMNIRKNDSKIQKGGRGFLDKPHIPFIKEIPILDDEIMGNILKISGLFALGSISPYTLIPVGLLMVLYEKYGADVLKIPKSLRSTSIRASRATSRATSQVAGQLLRRHLRQSQRGGECEEGPRPNLDWRDVGNTFVHHSNKPVSQFMSGGSREPWPNSIPQNPLQVSENIMTGQPHQFNRGAIYQNHDMQLSSISGLPSQLDIRIPYTNSMEGAGLPSCGANPSLASTQCSGLPRAMAGGSLSKSRSRNTKQKRSTRNRRQMRGGASSDWRGMLYSLGPTNTVDMPSAQFKAFSQTTPQTPNSALNGGFNGTSNFYNYDSYRNVNDYTPLYTQSVTGQIPQSNMELGSCGSGVPSARF